MKTFITCILLLAFAALLFLFKDFLLAIAIAALMAVATGNLSALLRRKIASDSLCALLLTAGLCALFLGPIVYASFTIVSWAAGSGLEEISHALARLKTLQMPEWLGFARPYIEEFFAAPAADIGEQIPQLARKILGYVGSFSGRGMRFFIDLLLIIVFYFFANFYGPALLSFAKRLLPLSAEQCKCLLAGLSSTMSVVFYSALLTAVFEGFLFAIIAQIYGYDAILCGILYAIGSLIPLIGGALLWVPLAALRYVSGDALGAIVIAGYSVVIISGVADTLLKPLIIRYVNDKFLGARANVNELLIFFAMVAGLGVFGFWGVILGPAILAFFLASARLFAQVMHAGESGEEGSGEGG